jgi:hypothetical protein
VASVTDSNDGSISCTLTVTEGDPNAAGNSSPISWVLTAKDSFGATNSGTPATGTVTINGVEHDYDYLWSVASTAGRTLAHGDQTIPHNADGTKSLGFGFTFDGVPGTSNSSGASKSSSTALDPIPPTAPTGLTVGTQNTPGTVPLSWTRGAGSTPATYQVQRSFTSDFAGTLTKTTSSTSYDFTDLPRGTLVYFRVRAHNASGYGPWSSKVSVRTLSGGKRFNGTEWVPTTIAKRLDGAAWVDLTIAKRFDGANWVNLT